MGAAVAATVALGLPHLGAAEVQTIGAVAVVPQLVLDLVGGNRLVAAVASVAPPVARVHHARGRGRQQPTIDVGSDTETEFGGIHEIAPFGGSTA
jgi:hypothetical protein